MNKDNKRHDETESVGAPMIRLRFAEFKLAPQFEHLKDAPMGEFETCDTIWPVGLDRMQSSDPATRRLKMWTLDAVTALLEKYRQRATYAAVSGVVGSTPRTIMSTHPKIPRNSWVVSKKNGLPSGYAASQMHCDLKKHGRIISESKDLLDWLENPT
jgi:hypothetical protein